MKYTYRMFEDNAGGLHLAILNEDGECVYYLSDFDRGLVLDTLAALKDGGDPIAGQLGGAAKKTLPLVFARSLIWLTQVTAARKSLTLEVYYGKEISGLSVCGKRLHCLFAGQLRARLP